MLLGYPAEVINFENLDHIRELVAWLEDQYIRLYKIDDRTALRSDDSETWSCAFIKYLADLKCPFASKDSYRKEAVEWLLDLAIISLYDKAPEAANLTTVKLEDLKEEKERKQKASDPISALDFHGEDFKKGLEDLRNLLGIGLHPNSDVVLKASCKFIVDNLSDKTIETRNKMENSTSPTLPLNKLDMGMTTTKNGAIDAAVRALRLIHLENLRETQTEINEVIVAVQEITADPKTDKRLGKVGY